MSEIIIVDDQPPEVVAMLQALYSRSPKSVKEHLEQVRARGADKFMSTYYVGYGHKSIGDCGTTSIFLENISILAAKAVQDTPLYNGQEASTRYLDMTKQEVLNPLGTDEGRSIQEAWMKLYATVIELLVPILKSKFPIQEGEKESIWEKAIKAKAFDIARGLLPGGITTYVAWHTNLRQAYDHLKEMRNHPLPEVRALTDQALGQLKTKYAPSFSHKVYPAEEEYIAKSMQRFAFYDDPEAIVGFGCKCDLDLSALAKYQDLLASRPPKAELHQRFRQFGSLTFTFPLDFGSYRDLQRQRSCVQEMPLLTTKYGFFPWYISHMPEWVQGSIADIKSRVDALPTDDLTKQYYTAIGFTVPVKITCSLPSAVYIAELRSSDTVHPTLRAVAQLMGARLKDFVPGLTMHHDTSPGTWNIKRGTQDIVKVQ